MAVKDQVIDMRPLGMIFTVVKSKTDTDGASLDLRWELLPGCNMTDPLFHKHPHAIETYEILEGEMEFYVKDRWIRAMQGDKLQVEKGVTHAFRNPTEHIVKVYNTHEPAFDMEDYFEDIPKLLDKAGYGPDRPVNMKNPRTLLLFGRLMNNYRKEIVAIKPPDFLVRLLGRIASLFGVDYK